MRGGRVVSRSTRAAPAPTVHKSFTSALFLPFMGLWSGYAGPVVRSC